jgi:MFS family permease
MDSENKSIHTSGSRLSLALALYPLAHLAVEVYNSILSIMWPLLTARFGLTYSAVGLLTMLFRGPMTLPQLAFAPLSDRHGSRRPAVCGLVWMAVGMSLVGLAPNVGVLADHMGMQPALLSNSGLPVIGIACTLAVYRLTRRPAAGAAAPTLGH